MELVILGVVAVVVAAFFFWPKVSEKIDDVQEDITEAREAAEEKFEEIARNLGGPNPYNIAKPQILRMVNDMQRIGLNNQFLFDIEDRLFRAEGGQVESSLSLNLEDYLLPEVQTPPLPMQPMPSAQILQPQPQAPGAITQNGLTPTENALLSEEEKQIRLRQRGLA